MSPISPDLRRLVRQRAGDRCEYCRLPQEGQEATFHLDHVVNLFNPRNDGWSEHFLGDGARLVGRTETGRATVRALDMNRPLILAIRQEEALLGRHPARSE
jgi:hypothetical protein